MAKTAAVAELKANLSRYLSRVKAGEEILVTERGVAVARLVPVAPTGLERLRELERQGLVRLGNGKVPRNFWKLARPGGPASAVRKGLREERDEGW